MTREGLERIIDGINDLEPYRDFLKTRWVGMVMWWHQRSVGARRKYFLLRWIVVVGGVLIPVLAALNMRPGSERIMPVAIAILGAIVAGCAAWEGVANYGEIWREKRRAAELLKVEGWQLFQRCGKYEADESYEKAFRRFALEVESMIAREVGEYLAVFDQSLTQARQAAAQVLKDIVEDTRQRSSQTSAGAKGAA